MPGKGRPVIDLDSDDPNVEEMAFPSLPDNRLRRHGDMTIASYKASGHHKPYFKVSTAKISLAVYDMMAVDSGDAIRYGINHVTTLGNNMV